MLLARGPDPTSALILADTVLDQATAAGDCIVAIAEFVS
jgi:hypothetical protein